MFLYDQALMHCLIEKFYDLKRILKMTKAKEVKKEDRKKPTKTLKEKRLAKQEKKKTK